MERGDIGTRWVKRQVVVLDPTLVFTRKRSIRHSINERFRNWQWLADRYEINMGMVAFIKQTGYLHSVPTEIWGFNEEPLFDLLVDRIAPLVGDYVSSYHRFEDPIVARMHLQTSPDITAVYDADPDRVDLHWRFRGTRVAIGKAP